MVPGLDKVYIDWSQSQGLDNDTDNSQGFLVALLINFIIISIADPDPTDPGLFSLPDQDQQNIDQNHQEIIPKFSDNIFFVNFESKKYYKKIFSSYSCRVRIRCKIVWIRNTDN